jgi:hypothetical protein
MATRSYSVPIFGGGGKLYEKYTNTSTSSGRDSQGNLVLRSNPHAFGHSKCTMWTNVAPGKAFTCQGAEANPTYPFSSAENNQVYAKFVGKLRKGSGSLGVTAASWRQSRQMIVDRLKKIDRIFDRAQRMRNRNPRRRRYSSRDLASDFLEGEFGWVPLLGDIFAVADSICGAAFPRQWVSATSRFNHQSYSETLGSPSIFTTETGWGRVTCSAGVDIANPNLWLLNRCGLINPAVVAWDLVPWSFVVNMFVNVNQVLGSFTDTLGLNLSNANTTRSSSILQEQRTYTRISSQEAYNNHSNVMYRFRSRVAGSIPQPSLRFKLPNVNFELMAIASALTRQKVGRMR